MSGVDGNMTAVSHPVVVNIQWESVAHLVYIIPDVPTLFYLPPSFLSEPCFVCEHSHHGRILGSGRWFRGGRGRGAHPCRLSVFIPFDIRTTFLQLIGGARFGLIVEEYQRQYTHYAFVLEDTGGATRFPNAVAEVN